MGDSRRAGLRARLQNLQRQTAAEPAFAPAPPERRPEPKPAERAPAPERAPRVERAPAPAAGAKDTRERPAESKPQQQPPKKKPQPSKSVGFDAGAWIMAIGATAAMAYGWQNRAEGYITAEKGVGYWLGIVGGTMMLLLLLYPLRKKYRSWRILGTVPAWFRLHMILGIVGPALIMYHCNFKLGSTNSNLALFSMLIVAGSGVIGRYLYRKIHLGLYGEKLKIREMVANALAKGDEVSQYVADAPGVIDEMKAYEQKALNHPETLRGAVWGLITVSFKSNRSRRRLIRATTAAIKADAKELRWSGPVRRSRLADAKRRINEYFRLIKKAANLAFYERLFALWHILHLPLFFVLILTTVVHIVAVHLY